MMNNEKYIRQISLPNVGEVGQKKLSEAKVLLIGAGGLANAMLPTLAATGIGTIGIIDGDTVSLSNLHRQTLFSEEDIQHSKVAVAAKRLQKQYPEVIIEQYPEYFHAKNALNTVRPYDIVVDATDNIATRYLINDACVLAQKPFVHASVYRFQFQVATFNVNGSGTYRCLYKEPPVRVQNCSEAGVMPTTVALAGMYQANEVCKYILGVGNLMTNTVLLVDVLTNSQHEFDYDTKTHAFITEAFFNRHYQTSVIQYINFEDAKKRNGVFLDVRNTDEYPKLSVIKNYVQIPLNTLEENIKQLDIAIPVYVFCQSGKRSKLAYKRLKELQFETVYCLNENAIALHHEEENCIY